MRPVSYRGRLFAAVFAALWIVADQALAAACALPNEKLALDTRVLQSELMVAALTCSQYGRYNAFVRKFENQLVINGRALRQYFRRVNGNRADAEVTRFVTRLANTASARSLANGPTQYCSDSAALFTNVLGIDSQGLGDFMTRFPTANEHGIASCPLQASSTRDPKKD